jgi:hypothetical protein
MKTLEFQVVYLGNKATIEFPGYTINFCAEDIQELICMIQSEICRADDIVRDNKPISFKGTFVYE